MQSIRAAGHDVPGFDPLDGGIYARTAFLLESPGPRVVGSRFISRDNPDPSANNMTCLLSEAGLSRQNVVLWNVVPYSVSTISENRNASATQVRDAIRHTTDFLHLLRDLTVIVFCGRRAQIAIPLLTGCVKNIHILETFHPGAMAYNRAHLREHMHQTFRKAAMILAN